MKFRVEFGLAVGIIAISLLVPACRKRADPGSSSAVPTEPVFKAATATTPTAQVKLLTDALTTWEDWNSGQTLTNLNQLVEAKVIDQLPAPPPGKKFAVDARLHQVVLINQ